MGRCASYAVRSLPLLAILTVLAGCSGGGGTAPTSVPRTTPPTTSAAASSMPSMPSMPSMTTARPAYIASVRWVRDTRGRSLHVVPTAAGRVTKDDGAQGDAWREVVRRAPDAATATMRAQFDCHWQYARLAQPAKPSWNLETWRPVVSAQAMFDARCNPGGPEE